MKKVFCLVAFALGATTLVNAQISSGEVSSKVIRTGNRAQAGDFGLYLGATSDIFKGIGNSDVNISALPLLNFKYMSTDNLEYRIGLEWWNKSYSQETKSNDATTGESKFVVSPGFAYHFSNKNLLDVYAGAELPIGFGSKSVDAGDEMSASMFRIGLGGFIGLQAYVANLPLAIGVEYGLSTQYNSVTDGSMIMDGQNIHDIDKIQEDLDISDWKLGSQVRVTLSYYFNSK